MRIFNIFIVFIFCCSLAFADGLVISPSSVCTETYTQTVGATTFSGFNVPEKYYNGIIIAGSPSGSLCSFTVKLTRVTGDITSKNFVAVLYSMSSVNLSTVISTSSPVPGNNGWSATEVVFTFPSNPVLSTGQAIVITMNGYDASNYVNMVGTLTNEDLGFAHMGKWRDTLVNNDYNTGYDFFYRIGTI